ncbi:hypothetical protein FHS50_001539 [Sphingomicrobium lutaoense]|uniref:Uncharacterized protein n=2 Tax=Sphingomicrobium lutaoense TaxID=515949 RepID=A0A839YZT7_9SPHN|nr:hypothetical protein [Sphingomicrobium lutaoense]MBB3764516.1 hypothetical protein [Sphingomicrobium lutaoense]
MTNVWRASKMETERLLFLIVAVLLGPAVFLNGLTIYRSGRSLFGHDLAEALQGLPFTYRKAGLLMMAVGPLATIAIVTLLLTLPEAG